MISMGPDDLDMLLESKLTTRQNIKKILWILRQNDHMSLQSMVRSARFRRRGRSKLYNNTKWPTECNRKLLNSCETFKLRRTLLTKAQPEVIPRAEVWN